MRYIMSVMTATNTPARRSVLIAALGFALIDTNAHEHAANFKNPAKIYCSTSKPRLRAGSPGIPEHHQNLKQRQSACRRV